jgi:intein/homing endonuclease
MISFVDPHYTPRYYQIPVFQALHAGIKRVFLVWHRRAGKDKTCWEAMLSKAFEEAGNYWYMFPEYAQGRKAFWESIDIAGKRIIDYIPEPLLYKTPSNQSMTIYLKTKANIEGKDPKSHSTIQVVGADQPDSLRGSNPKGVIASEYSEWKKPSVLETIIEPILVENGGWLLINCCITKETLVYTKKGIKPLLNTKPSGKNLTLAYNPYTLKDGTMEVYGREGFNTVTDFFYAGMQETLQVETNAGYKLTGTPKHKLLTKEREWKRFDELVVGDEVCVARGMHIESENNQKEFDREFYAEIERFKQERVIRSTRKHKRVELVPDSNFFYLCGLFLAEGSYHGNNSINITNPDVEIVDFLKNTYGFAVGKDSLHHVKNHNLMVHLFKWFGLKHAKGKEKELPHGFYEISTQHQCAFLKGYFDGDGTVRLKNKKVQVACCSASPKLIEQLQVVLLNYGIITYLTKADIPPSQKVKVPSTSYSLYMTGYSVDLYKKHIGFTVQRKKQKLEEASNFSFYGDMARHGVTKENKKTSYRTLYKNKHKLTPKALKELEECYFYTKIKNITPAGVQEVYDYVVPKTNSYMANGLISHNTPKGKQAAYYLYQAAKASPSWFTSLLTIDDTQKRDATTKQWVPIVSQADIEAIRNRKQTPEEIILQEYYCDFNAPLTGLFYAQALETVDLRRAVIPLTYNPNLHTYTSWDLGLNDATAIWWFQYDPTSKTLYAIDYEEYISTSLPDICHHVIAKPYRIKAHIAPHDIVQRGYESGLTRYHIARQHGVSFQDATNTLTKAKKLPILDGIEASRNLIPRTYFCQYNAQEGLECLRNYKRKYEPETNTYGNTPIHDKYSHGADAFRTFAVWFRENESRLNLTLNPAPVRAILPTSVFES